MALLRPDKRRFAPRRTGDGSPLGDLENAVMDVIWSCHERLSVSDVHGRLILEPGAKSDLAYTTVKTTMERLSSKGILLQTRAGKAYLYTAAVSKEELERRIVAQVLENLVAEFPGAVASFFVRPDPGISEDKLALLSQAIENAGNQEPADD